MKLFALFLFSNIFIFSASSMPIYKLGKVDDSSIEFESSNVEDRLMVNLSSRKTPQIATRHKSVIPWLGMSDELSNENRIQFINFRRLRAYRPVTVVVNIKFWNKSRGHVLLKVSTVKGRQLSSIYKLTDENLEYAWRFSVPLSLRQTSETIKVEVVSSDGIEVGQALLDQVSVDVY